MIFGLPTIYVTVNGRPRAEKNVMEFSLPS